MSDLLDYRLDGAVAVLGYDDGKANVFGHAGIDALHEALDRAEQEARSLLLVGRPGKFSAGFDLSVMTSGAEPMRALVGAGAELALRLFMFPMPVVAACTGHALAMGAIMLLACDVRVGAEGAFKVGLNEVAIGMGLPHFAVELARYRMPPSQFDTAVLGRVFDPLGAVTAGYLDRTVPADDVLASAQAEATELAGLSSGAVAHTKRLARGPVVEAIRAQFTADIAALGPPA